MTLSTSILAFDDAILFLDRALEDPKGVRACFGDNYGNAQHYRMRCHAARNLVRQENAKLYPDPQDPMHGRSTFDVLTLRIIQDENSEWWVYAMRNVMPEVVESLSTFEAIEHTPPLQIEDKSNA